MAARTSYAAVFKVLVRIGAVLLSLALVLTLALTGVGYWIYRNPLEAFQLVEKYILPADLKITWKKIDFGGARIGGLDFLIDIGIEGLHIQKGSPAIEVPLDHVRIQATILPFKREGRLHLVEGTATAPVIFQASPDVTPEPEKNPLQQIQSVIRILDLIHTRLPIEQFDATVDQFVYRPVEGDDLTIRASLHQDFESPVEIAASLTLDGKRDPKRKSEKADGPTTPLKLAAHAVLDFDKMNTKEVFLTAGLDLDGRGLKTVQQLGLIFNEGQARLTSTGAVLYQKEKLKLQFSPDLVGDFKSNEAHLVLKTDVRGIPGPLVKVEKIVLDLKTPLEEGNAWSQKPSRFSLHAPIEIFFVDKTRRALMEKSCACKLPEVVKAAAEGQVWLSTLLDAETPKHVALDAKLSVESVHNKIFAIDLGADLKIEKEKSSFEFFPHLDCTATVHRFQSLKPLLDSKNVLIPAPFDVLDGSLAFKANGPVAKTERGQKFPLALEIDLASKTQKVKVDTEASVEINSKFTEAHADVKARILSLFLDLPPLDPLDGLPRIAPDSRFIKNPDRGKKPPPKFKLTFNFEVETLGASAIRLASKYFRPYLPLTLKVQSADGNENTGFVQSEPFDITYLRRTVHVENLKIDFSDDDKGVFPLKGRLRVQQTQYTVFIDIEGTTKNPAVTMSSEPYLPKNEIVSVLLYDRTSDQLVSGDAETAGGVQAAIADRAIGLFGLWAFASTPIKSFSYNPVTKVYTATVAVSDDLTAGVGTDWEAAAHLELRKRISKRWSLTAAWTPATQDEDAVSKLVLQWEKRF